MKMAHYAYKCACYDIDYPKFQQLVKQFEEQEGREHDGDSNYDGDNWYIMEMWIRELRAENERLRASPASVPEVTDGMAIAFHNALTDGSIGQSEVDEIKTGLRAAIAAASTPASIRGKDAERFRFMLDDHAEKTTRQRVRELFERLPVMSLSAARAAIDDLLKGE